MDSWWFLAFLISGCYQVGDGVGSIAKYWHQTLLEQVPRLIRAGTGSFVVYAIFLLFNPYWLTLAPVCIVASMLTGAYLGWTRRMVLNSFKSS
jgi:hypothetical protein